MNNEMRQPELSPSFTLSDIRALRDYWGPIHAKMSDEELFRKSREAGEQAERRIAEIRARKAQVRQG
jgi:hypothetical protein